MFNERANIGKSWSRQMQNKFVYYSYSTPREDFEALETLGWLCLKMIDLISLAHCFWCTSLGDEMPKHPSYLHEFWCLQRHFRSIRKISSQNRPIWGICSLWKLTIIHPYDSVNGMVLLFWWYSMSYDIPRINHQPTTTTTAEWSSFQGWHMLGPVSNPLSRIPEWPT